MEKIIFFALPLLVCITVAESLFGGCSYKKPNDLLEGLKKQHPQINENNSLIRVSGNLTEIATENS